ncbi:MAG TPA: urease accessory UreF family protein [Acidimicrobiales bacterium]
MPRTADMPGPAGTGRAMTLLLADARLPTGAHVHSGGMEQAVDDAVVTDLESLVPFLHGRLMTGGRLCAHAAAMACTLAARRDGEPTEADWRPLDEEITARIVSPALRATSRRQGRSLLRTGAALYVQSPLHALDAVAPGGPHLAVVQGALAHHGGIGPHDAALIAAYGSVTSPASAALRLLGLDPLSVSAALARLAPAIDQLATEAARHAFEGPDALPSPASPLSDLLGDRHAGREERLFAS